MKRGIFTLLFLLVALFGFGQKVAISPTTGSAEKGVKNALCEAILDGISNSGQYIIVERANFSAIIQEFEFQSSGFVDDEQIAEIGKAAGAQYVCISSINKIGYNYQINYRLVNVTNGTVVAKDKKTANESTLLEVIDAISKEKLFVSINSSDQSYSKICGLEIQKNDFGEHMLNAKEQQSVCPFGWRLPNLNELKCMCEEKEKIGNFNYGEYWSSERRNKIGIGVRFNSCAETNILYKASVRCVRYQ